MGINWFGKRTPAKPPAIEKAPDKIDDATHRYMKIEWIRNTTTSAISDLFAEYERSIKSTYAHQVKQDGYVSPSEKELQEKLLYNMDVLREKWFVIDREIVNEDEAVFMYECLFKVLSPMVTTYQSLSMEATGLDTYEMDEYAESLIKQFKTLAQIRDNQYLGDGKVRPTPPAKAAGSYEFPVISTSNSQLSNRLHEVGDVWTEAFKGNLSIEDEYFLEQTATNYIPEAWKMYSTFRLASEEARQTAENILIEQLDLIEGQIKIILDRHLTENLNRMKTQTEFLRTKTSIDSGVADFA